MNRADVEDRLKFTRRPIFNGSFSLIWLCFRIFEVIASKYYNDNTLLFFIYKNARFVKDQENAFFRSKNARWQR